MIKIQLTKASNGLIFQILSMPDALRQMDQMFVSSCGYTISSSSVPELICPDKLTPGKIYLRGYDVGRDADITVQAFTTPEALEYHYNAIIRTMSEFVSSELYQELLDNDVTPDDPDVLCFSRKNR